MPFSKTENHDEDYWTDHYEKFLKPTIELSGLYEVHRSKALSGDILKQIITDLVVSKLVVADLTDANPNVYWELGVRQSFKHGTITIAEAEKTELPFDVGGKGTLFYYPNSHIKQSQFLIDFQTAIRQIHDSSCVDSQVLETIAGRGTFFQVIQKDEAIRRVQGLIDEVNEDKNLLDMMLETIDTEQKAPLGYFSFQYCSLEHLLTQRYLEDLSLYTDARNLYFVILATNSMISKHKDDWNKLKTILDITGLKELESRLVSFKGKLDALLDNLEEIR
jgi:hypothetical protein